ncbi:MAG: ABC-F family ATP-binding cassette domain-containing protein [Clostridiales bacterium]|nr:ABC-F family ATP-binding cassette domain-containing protein [Clostridiales bacterium]
MNVLDVQNLTLSFGENTLFSGVSFDVQDREKVGVVGVNGVGKTSLFKIITGEYQPDSGNCFLSKNTRLGYMEQHTCSENRTIWQELISVFSDLIEMENELEAIAEKLKTDSSRQLIERQDDLTNLFQQHGGLTYKSLTRSAFLGLGFTENEFDSPTSKLSGGQKSKLILAKLLLSDADFLLLDEPTNHLDISAIQWLEEFLKNFKGACMIISHDRYFLDKITDKTVEIENYKVRSYKGNYSVFLQKKAAEQKAVEDKYNNDIKEIERLEGIIAQQHRWNREKNIKTAESKEKVVERIKAQLVIPDSKVQKIRFDFTPKCVSGEDVLEVRGLKKSFGSNNVFSNVNFEVKRGERVFLLGDNGCGKTTLLKILMGDLSRDDGNFRFGANLMTGYFDQVQAKLDLSKSVIDEVWTAFPFMTETKVRNALAAFLFKGDEVYRKLEVCSGGERARVALLKLMLGGFNFLLLDEPTNHLDAFSREELENTLLNYEGTMLIVSHDRYFINKLATRIIELTPDGCNNFTGNYSDYEAKRYIPQQKIEEKAKPKINDYKLKKERQSSLRKLKSLQARLECEIDSIEKELTEIEEKMSTSSYEELKILTTDLDSKTRQRDELYSQWEKAAEQLEELNCDE